MDNDTGGASADDERSTDAEIKALLKGLGPVADRLGHRAAVAQFEADLGDPARTRAGTSLAGSAGPLPRFLPMRDIVRISFNLHSLLPPDAILRRVAGSTRLPTDDNLVACLPYAPSLGAALELASRYVNVTLPWFRVRLEDMGDMLCISWRPVAPLGRIAALSTELALFTTYRMVANFAGEQIAQARVHFALQPVSDPAERFACRITVGAGESHMAIPPAWYGRASPHHDPVLWRDGVAKCEADIDTAGSLPAVAEARLHIARALDAARVQKLEDTARQLGLSRRTLVRLLANNGTTHHRLVEEERRHRALLQLGRTAGSLAEIAETLGFPDQSSFGRKCRVWFGETPANLRLKLAAGSSG